jgi:hypothetical protein
MLAFALSLLSLTVLLGAALVVSGLRHPGRPPSRLLVALHGHAALFSFGPLFVIVEHNARGVATGTQSFGIIAAILLLLAAGLGFTTLALHWRRRNLPGFWAGAHATAAITGYVILAVYLLLR